MSLGGDVRICLKSLFELTIAIIPCACLAVLLLCLDKKPAFAVDVDACYPAEFVQHLESTYGVDSGVLTSDDDQFVLGYSLAGESDCTYLIRYDACVEAGIEKATAGIHLIEDDRWIGGRGVKETSLSKIEQLSIYLSGEPFFGLGVSYRVKGGGWFSNPAFSNLKVQQSLRGAAADDLSTMLSEAATFCSYAHVSEHVVAEEAKKFVDGVAAELTASKEAADARAESSRRALEERTQENNERQRRELIAKCVRERDRRAGKGTFNFGDAMDVLDDSFDRSCANAGIKLGVDANREGYRQRGQYWDERAGRRRPPIEGFGR